jgi:hypothetical protein
MSRPPRGDTAFRARCCSDGDVVSPRAERCRQTTNGLRTCDGGSGIGGELVRRPVEPAGAIEIEFAAGVRIGRCFDAEGSGRSDPGVRQTVSINVTQ